MTNRLKNIGALGIVGLCATSAWASAEETAFDFGDPASVAAVMQEQGYRAKLSTQDSGRPVIFSGVGGSNFELVFFSCENAKRCDGILFSSGFDLTNGLPLKKVSEWNETRLIGRAFLDNECDPIVDYYVSSFLDVSRDAFFSLIDAWDGVLVDFEDHIGFNEKPSGVVVDCASGDDAA